MVIAFACFPDGTTLQLPSLDHLADAWERGATVWIDAENPTEEEFQRIDAVIDVDDSAWDDCLHGEQRPRIDEFRGHIFMVLYGVLGAEDEGNLRERKIAAFLGTRFLITVHHDPLVPVRALCDRYQRHPSHILDRGADFLLYTIIDMIVDNYIAVAETYETRLERLEEISLDDSPGDFLGELTRLRRDLLELRSLAVAQRELLAPLTKGDYEYVSVTLEQRFRHVCDHLTKVVELVDGLRELLNAARDNYHSSIAMRTNSTMRTLTVVSVILLPLTLVAGIYGMNMPLWPRQDDPLNFWIVLLLMGIIAGSLLSFFRRSGWM